MKTKVTNQEVLNIVLTYGEIIGCKEGKKELQDSGRIISQMIACLNKIKPLYDQINETRNDIQKEALSTLEPNQPITQRLQLETNIHIDEYLAQDAGEVEVFQLTEKQCELFLDLLGGPGSITLYTFFKKDGEVKDIGIKKVDA